MKKSGNSVWIGAFLLIVVPAYGAAANADGEMRVIEPAHGLAVASEKLAPVPQRTWHVRCDRGSSLADTLSLARAGDTIKISGTCAESVVIDTDRLSLIGLDDAGIDGGNAASEAVVKIDGARGVTLDNLFVRNGFDQGILLTHQAQAVLQNLAVHSNGTVGLSVDRSHVDITDVSLDNNGGGMDAYAGSTVVARGLISASNNTGDGLAANGKTYFEIRGAEITANGNFGMGLAIINDSRLQIFSFPEAQGSSVVADGNGFAGIGLLGSELGVVGFQYDGSGANLISASNSFYGFYMPAGSIVSPHATARFIAEQNDTGLLMEDGASAVVIGGLNVTGNRRGIAADGAGTLTLVSHPSNPSIVDGNSEDLFFGFGTRATIGGLQVGSISCDASVQVRGTVNCP